MTSDPADRRKRWEELYAGGLGPRTPSEFVVTHVDRLKGRILDVAAGNGRNAVFMARHGACVDLVDRAISGLRDALTVARTERLAIQPVQADLQNFPLPQNAFDAIVNLRYLQRSLFGAFQTSVKPGGYVLFETFLVDQRQIGHPRNPEFLLQRGELRQAFESFEMIEYWEGRLESDQPAFVARMLARRPLHSRD